MIGSIDPSDLSVAVRIVEIQRSAYAVEAELIGFDGIPQLGETVEEVRALTDMHWRGAFDDQELVGVIAWRVDDEVVDIDRLAVDPAHSRRGYGRRLVRTVPTGEITIVSTGAENAPARSLYMREGFVHVGETEVAPNIFLANFRRDAARRPPM